MKNLRKEYSRDFKCLTENGKQKSTVAVSNISFAVKYGEIFGLLGPNGAGKTTTLNMIISETLPTCGKVFCVIVSIKITKNK